ncbi:MAG: DHH family phosphoesterase [Planctomycetes bacterium]|nr:DHH family phosphoesterase [Planctomycetota bacterium]
MDRNASVEEVARHLLSLDRLLLTTHLTPDGDGLGSELAILRHLRSLGRDVTILNCSTVPEDLRFLVRPGEVITYQKGKHDRQVAEASGIVAFDLGAAGRLGRMEGPVRISPASKILIDHHIFDNDLFDVLYLDVEASSTAELCLRLLRALGMESLSLPIAEPLYVGLLQDTGSFNYNSTSARVHRIAADFLEAGVDPYRIWKKLNCQKPYARVRLMGESIARIELQHEGRTALAVVDLDFLKKSGGEARDAFEVVNHLLSIHGVEVGCFALQLASDKVKFSLRSGGRHDVCGIAKEFGGGGHRFAAGFTTQGMALAEAVQLVMERVARLGNGRSPG